MSKKNPSPGKGPKKSQIAKAKEIEKLIQAAQTQPKRVKQFTKQARPEVDRFTDGSSLVLSEGKQVRLPLAQLYPKPILNGMIERRPKPPATQTLPLTSFHELEIDGTTVVMKDERHNNQGFVQLPLVKLPLVPSQPKQPFRFLNLPKEIQDMVFEQVISRDQYHITWLNNHRRTKTLSYRRSLGLPKLLPNVLTRRASQRRQRRADRTTILSHVYTSYSPVSTLWVNRQFYLRASRVFYHKSVFTFSNFGPFRQFLNSVSIPNKESIRSLKLIHTPYGHPRQTSHRLWKTVYDHAWIALCLRVQKEMPNIRFLNLELRMHSTPLAFAPLDLSVLCCAQDFRIGWLVPLCLFKELPLERCYVKVLSNVKAETVLEVESWKLRKELMGERWDEEKEARRDAFGFARRKKGKKEVKVLRIGC